MCENRNFWHKLHPTRHGHVMCAVFCVICAKGVDK